MPDHMPPSFAPDSPPDLDSREVQPINALHEQIETARAIKTVAHEAGYRSGYEAGRRAAQTEIDAATYERGVSDERARVQSAADKHLAPMLPDASRYDVTERLTLFFAALRDPAPNT